MNNLADHINRLEKKLSAKDHEILDSKRKLKSNEPFIQGFNKMWENQVREKKEQKETGRERIRGKEG